MSKIIFIIGPVSSGKTTVADMFKNSVKLNIDYFYEKHMNQAKDFEASYRDKKFQDKCWNNFYKEIRKNKLKHKLVTAQTTGLNPRFKQILNKLKGEFGKEVLIIKVKAPKSSIIKRSKKRLEKEYRKETGVKSIYKRLKRKHLKANFIINNNKDNVNLKMQVEKIQKVLK